MAYTNTLGDGDASRGGSNSNPYQMAPRRKNKHRTVVTSQPHNFGEQSSPMFSSSNAPGQTIMQQQTPGMFNTAGVHSGTSFFEQYQQPGKNSPLTLKKEPSYSDHVSSQPPPPNMPHTVSAEPNLHSLSRESSAGLTYSGSAQTGPGGSSSMSYMRTLPTVPPVVPSPLNESHSQSGHLIPQQQPPYQFQQFTTQHMPTQQQAYPIQSSTQQDLPENQQQWPQLAQQVQLQTQQQEHQSLQEYPGVQQTQQGYVATQPQQEQLQQDYFQTQPQQQQQQQQDYFQTQPQPQPQQQQQQQQQQDYFQTQPQQQQQQQNYFFSQQEQQQQESFGQQAPQQSEYFTTQQQQQQQAYFTQQQQQEESFAPPLQQQQQQESYIQPPPPPQNEESSVEYQQQQQAFAPPPPPHQQDLFLQQKQQKEASAQQQQQQAFAQHQQSQESYVQPPPPQQQDSFAQLQQQQEAFTQQQQSQEFYAQPPPPQKPDSSIQQQQQQESFVPPPPPQQQDLILQQEAFAPHQQLQELYVQPPPPQQQDSFAQLQQQQEAFTQQQQSQELYVQPPPPQPQDSFLQQQQQQAFTQQQQQQESFTPLPQQSQEYVTQQQQPQPEPFAQSTQQQQYYMSQIPPQQTSSDQSFRQKGSLEPSTMTVQHQQQWSQSMEGEPEQIQPQQTQQTYQPSLNYQEQQSYLHPEEEEKEKEKMQVNEAMHSVQGNDIYTTGDNAVYKWQEQQQAFSQHQQPPNEGYQVHSASLMPQHIPDELQVPQQGTIPIYEPGSHMSFATDNTAPPTFPSVSCPVSEKGYAGNVDSTVFNDPVLQGQDNMTAFPTNQMQLQQQQDKEHEEELPNHLIHTQRNQDQYESPLQKTLVSSSISSIISQHSESHFPPNQTLISQQEQQMYSNVIEHVTQQTYPPPTIATTEPQFDEQYQENRKQQQNGMEMENANGYNENDTDNIILGSTEQVLQSSSPTELTLETKPEFHQGFSEQHIHNQIPTMPTDSFLSTEINHKVISQKDLFETNEFTTDLERSSIDFLLDSMGQLNFEDSSEPDLQTKLTHSENVTDGHRDGSSIDNQQNVAPGRAFIPLLSRPPIAMVSFGFNGTLVVIQPTKTASEPSKVPLIRICSLKNILKDTSYYKELVHFPGPLIKGTTKKSVLALCNQKAQAGGEGALLWQLMAILVEYDGVLRTGVVNAQETTDPSVVATINMVLSSRPTNKLYGECAPVPQPTVFGPVRGALQEMHKLLLLGKRKEAVNVAVRGQLWDHALVISSHIDASTFHEVVAAFTDHELPGTHALPSLYNLYCNRPPVLDVQQWQETVAMMYSNWSRGSKDIIGSMADALMVKGQVDAAHICYLLSGETLQPLDADPKMVLLGGDHARNPRAFLSPLSLQLSQVYEYSQTLGNLKFNNATQQVFCLIYAEMLAEVGHWKIALGYCMSILSVVKKAGQDIDTYSRDFLLRLQALHHRICYRNPVLMNSSASSVGKIVGGFEKMMAALLHVPDESDKHRSAGHGQGFVTAGGRVMGEFQPLFSAQDTPAVPYYQPDGAYSTSQQNNAYTQQNKYDHVQQDNQSHDGLTYADHSTAGYHDQYGTADQWQTNNYQDVDQSTIQHETGSLSQDNYGQDYAQQQQQSNMDMNLHGYLSNENHPYEGVQANTAGAAPPMYNNASPSALSSMERKPEHGCDHRRKEFGYGSSLNNPTSKQQAIPPWMAPAASHDSSSNDAANMPAYEEGAYDHPDDGSNYPQNTNTSYPESYNESNYAEDYSTETPVYNDQGYEQQGYVDQEDTNGYYQSEGYTGEYNDQTYTEASVDGQYGSDGNWYPEGQEQSVGYGEQHAGGYNDEQQYMEDNHQMGYEDGGYEQYNQDAYPAQPLDTEGTCDQQQKEIYTENVYDAPPTEHDNSYGYSVPPSNMSNRQSFQYQPESYVEPNIQSAPSVKDDLPPKSEPPKETVKTDPWAQFEEKDSKEKVSKVNENEKKEGGLGWMSSITKWLPKLPSQ
eukprot:Ihof_evm4s97 gene=Ihof_evmTU4s97